MECWSIYLVLNFCLAFSTGLEVDILQNGETKQVLSVLQVKAGAAFALDCRSEACQSNCEGLIWRRQRKGVDPSLEAFSGSNWLNLTNAVLDDRGFYECVDAENKTRKVMYLVVQKQGFERESIGIIKNALGSIRTKRSYDPYDNRYYDNSYYNTNYNDKSKANNYNTNSQSSGSSKSRNPGIYWGLFGVVAVVALIYMAIKCCNQNSNTSNTRTTPENDCWDCCENYLWRQYRVNHPTLYDCLYPTAGSPYSTRTATIHDFFLPRPPAEVPTRTAAAIDPFLPRSPRLEVPSRTAATHVPLRPSCPALEVPTAPFLRENGLDEPPTYVKSAGNSVASSTTNLNEVEQNHEGQNAVDTCALPPTYDEAVHNIVQAGPEPPSSSDVCYSGNDLGGAAHGNEGGSTACDHGGGVSGGGDSGGGGGDSGGGGDDSGGGGGDSGGGGGDSGGGGDDRGGGGGDSGGGGGDSGGGGGDSGGGGDDSGGGASGGCD